MDPITALTLFQGATGGGGGGGGGGIPSMSATSSAESGAGDFFGGAKTMSGINFGGSSQGYESFIYLGFALIVVLAVIKKR